MSALTQAQDCKEINILTEKERAKAALTALQSAPETIQIYTKGLICESCGIGVRKKLQRLDFVDTKQPKKGIIMDVKTQLVKVSLKKGAAFQPAAIKKAIKGAGYDPMTLYYLAPNKVLRSINLHN